MMNGTSIPFMKSVEKEIDARERAPVSVCSPVKKQSRDYPTAAAVFANNSSPTCSYCDQSHSSSSCQTITDLGRRKQILMKSGWCFVCLKEGTHFQGLPVITWMFQLWEKTSL